MEDGIPQHCQGVSHPVGASMDNAGDLRRILWALHRAGHLVLRGRRFPPRRGHRRFHAIVSHNLPARYRACYRACCGTLAICTSDVYSSINWLLADFSTSPDTCVFCSGSIYAVLEPLGFAVGYPVTQSCVLVSGLCGILVYREIQGSARIGACKYFAVVG